MPDEADPNAISEKQKHRENSSAIPGCAILATIVTVFGGLVILYVSVGYYQTKKIAGFTDEEAMEVAVFEPSEEQIAHARQQVAAVKNATQNDAIELIKFSAVDLNSLIAAEPKVKDFRGNTQVTKVGDGMIEAEMSLPMRQTGFGKPPRYLNGTFVFKPEVRARTIAFKLLDIRQEGRDTEIPRPFIESFSAIDFFRLDPDDEDFEPVFRRLKRVLIEDDLILVQTKALDKG